MHNANKKTLAIFENHLLTWVKINYAKNKNKNGIMNINPKP
jgi:hypothetical protein